MCSSVKWVDLVRNKKRKKSANLPDLNTEGTKQKKIADQPKPQNGSTQSQARNLSYMLLLQSGMNNSQSPYQAQYAVNNGAQNLSACSSPPPMQNMQNMQSTPQQQLPNTLLFVLFDLILYAPSTIFQFNRDGSSWVEPVLSWDKCVLLKDHNAVARVRLEPAAPRSRVKHSTTEPLRSLTNTLPNMDVLSMVLARLDCIDSKLQRLDKIEKSVTDISQKVVHVVMNKKVMDLETKVASVEQGQQFESDTLQEIEKEQSTLQKDLLTLKTSQQKLIETENRVKEQMLDLQCREMRDNLLFFNVPEERGETDSDCEQKIFDIMQHDMEIENARSDIKLHRTHRSGRYINGKTRPIVT